MSNPDVQINFLSTHPPGHALPPLSVSCLEYIVIKESASEYIFVTLLSQLLDVHMPAREGSS